MDYEDEIMYDVEDDYMYDVDDDHSDDDDHSNDEFSENLNCQQKNYEVLNEQDIIRRQQEDIARVCNVYSVPKAAASLLLRNYKWSVSTLNEEWFADEDGVRKAVGLLKDPVVVQYRAGDKILCGICFEEYRSREIEKLDCGHPFCTDCWKGYISTAINNAGNGCLTLRCPDPSCKAAVFEDLIYKLASDKDKKRYQRYIVDSYVECNRKTKWCTAAGCDCAVEFVIGSESFDVSCACSNSFCWNCSDEAHRPVNCDTVAKWVKKNNNESENTTWILANSKPCPECKKPIEKNQGCNHMTCRCGHHFCWLCLDNWSKHGYSACNGFVDKDLENQREMAKKHIVRYAHYYERWMNNDNGRKKAIQDLQLVKEDRIKKISKKQDILEGSLQFVIDAWEQIIECRRVLKFSYAYGYYIPETAKTKKILFEYLQGEAETALERLHKCAEDELNRYAAESAPTEFNDFSTKVKGLTDVTRKFFENLVKGLENGLTEVQEEKKTKKTKGTNSYMGGSSSTRTRRPYITDVTTGGKLPNSVISDDDYENGDDNNDDEYVGAEAEYWTCDLCTLVNINPRRTSCKACNLER